MYIYIIKRLIYQFVFIFYLEFFSSFMSIESYIILLVTFMVFIVVAFKLIKHSNLKKNKKIAHSNNFKDTIQYVTIEHTNRLTNAFVRINTLYSDIIRDLAIQDILLLQNNKKKLKKLNKHVESLKDEIFEFLQGKQLENDTVYKFYILTVENLEDMTDMMNKILDVSKKHIQKKQKKLTFNQIRELKAIDKQSGLLFSKIDFTFSENKFDRFEELTYNAKEISNNLTQMLEAHINKINSINNNPKNFRLYTKLLKKSNELFGLLIQILSRYKEVYKQDN